MPCSIGVSRWTPGDAGSVHATIFGSIVQERYPGQYGHAVADPAPGQGVAGCHSGRGSSARFRCDIRPGQKLQALRYGNRLELIPQQSIVEARGFLRGIETHIEREDDRV
jgi:hypothetical protein